MDVVAFTHHVAASAENIAYEPVIPGKDPPIEQEITIKAGSVNG